MKNKNDITQEILSNLKHLDRLSPNPQLLDNITNQLDVETGKIIPLRQIKRLMVAASLLLAINTIVIVNNINSADRSEAYDSDAESSSLISDYKIYS